MQARKAPRPQQERTEATQRALMAAARRLFVRKGFAATGTPEIVAAAKVTRGALYHHYVDKTDLFFAVAREAAREVAREIAGASAGTIAPLDALLRGAQAYFAAMAAQGRARLLLLDAPSVLAPAQLMELSDLAGASELRAGLAELFAVPVPGEAPIEELTVLVSAAFDRAALAIAQGSPPERYHAAMRFVLEGLARR